MDNFRNHTLTEVYKDPGQESKPSYKWIAIRLEELIVHFPL